MLKVRPTLPGCRHRNTRNTTPEDPEHLSGSLPTQLGLATALQYLETFTTSLSGSQHCVRRLQAMAPSCPARFQRYRYGARRWYPTRQRKGLVGRHGRRAMAAAGSTKLWHGASAGRATAATRASSRSRSAATTTGSGACRGGRRRACRRRARSGRGRRARSGRACSRAARRSATRR